MKFTASWKVLVFNFSGAGTERNSSPPLATATAISFATVHQIAGSKNTVPRNMRNVRHVARTCGSYARDFARLCGFSSSPRAAASAAIADSRRFSAAPRAEMPPVRVLRPLSSSVSVSMVGKSTALRGPCDHPTRCSRARAERGRYVEGQ
jgi:hypothetical protein